MFPGSLPRLYFAILGVEKRVSLKMEPGHKYNEWSSPAWLRCYYINKQNIWLHHIPRKCTTGLRGRWGLWLI